MKLLSKSSELRNYINHYWVVNNSKDLFRSNAKVYGYPGIRPEIIFILKGHLMYEYMGKNYKTNESILASHINGRFLFDSSQLEQFIIVQFKPLALSSLQPFIKLSSKELMQNSICKLGDVYGQEIKLLESALIDKDEKECQTILDTFFLKKMDKNYNGFIVEMLYGLSYSEGISTILDRTGYSLSTLERYVKNETALTPKSFLSLRKYKTAVEEIFISQRTDWQYYIDKYNYTDQSHFIKTVKKYTGFTPTKLVNTPNLLSFRPLYS